MAIRMSIAVAAAHAALKAQVAKIDSLNVYPVPDGDTGTNMLLTLESVLRETSEATYETPEAASKAGARAALMGARGNSGVILSQMIRGACDVLARSASLSAETFVSALEGARERAYASIREPVEGTMLTVIKDAANAAREALESGVSEPVHVVGAAAREAHASVKRTPQLLATLREAGVVDAGGLGVAVILDALSSWLGGKEPEARDLAEPDTGGYQGSEKAGAVDPELVAWGYCTEFFVTGFSGDADEFGEHVHEIGQSVLVVSDDDLMKVHLHTQNPGEALSYAGGFGRLHGVKIDDMETQTREAQVRRNGGGSAEEAGFGSANVSVVVASRGAGSRRIFEEAGAVVVEGGQGANPSAADFARAVQATGSPEVVLLPNNKNIIPTVESLDELVEARVHVVPTTSIASGLAVLIAFDPEMDPDEVVEEMREVHDSLRCAEVTRSVRAASVDGHEVPEGAYLGLLDGGLYAVEEDVRSATMKIAEEILDGGAELLTLLKGEELPQDEAEGIAEEIRALDAEAEVQLLDGGQPMYPLQIVAE
jgi:DAK2 domain fusion protein YloV